MYVEYDRMTGKGGHIGGDMSVMDILVTLYFDQMNISPENHGRSGQRSVSF